MYKHIVFKAHYQDRCKGAKTHKRSSPPWPEGCLLVPTRIYGRMYKKNASTTPKVSRLFFINKRISPANTP